MTLRASEPATPQRASGTFRRIVVGIGGDGGAKAIALARALAATDAVFVLVHVHPEANVTGVLPPASAAQDVDRALTLLRGARKHLGVPCEIVVEAAGSTTDGLHDVAERESADLLVVEPHVVHEAWSHGLPGVLHHAPCAVAIAGPDTSDAPIFRTVAVAYRPTEAARHATSVARAVAGAHQAELQGVTVVPAEAHAWVGPFGSAMHELLRLDGTLAAVARADLAAIGLGAGHVLEGDPVQVLSHFSRSVDLLVLGTRAAGPLARMVCGETAWPVARNCACALLVVPRAPLTPTQKDA